MKNNSTWENFLKPVVVLVVICIVASAALAGTNQLTAPIIKAQEEAAANAAYLEVLPEADGFEEITDFQSSNVTKALKATNGAGWVIQAYGKGFGGDVPVVVAFDSEGTILKVKFMENSETAGFGQKLADPADADGQKLAESFVGKSGTLEAGDVDMISGVTVSSKAALSAVNSAVNCFNEVALGQAAVVEEEQLTPDQALESMELTEIEIPEGLTGAWETANGTTVLRTEANGYEYETAPLDVLVELDADGNILNVWVGTDGQTAGIGDQAGGAEYLNQYKGVLGEAGLDGVDTISGATQSTRGVKKGVRKCIQAFVAMYPDCAAATAVAPEGGDAESEAASSEAAVETVTLSDEACKAVLPDATTFEAVESATSGVQAAVKADTGWVIQASAKGFGGQVPVIVGLDADGAIVGVSFPENSETAGYGAQLYEEGNESAAALAASLVGKSGEVAIGDVDAISGATISSKAVVEAVNTALSCYNEVALGQAPAADEGSEGTDLSSMSAEEARAALAPGATLTQITAPEGLTDAWQGDDGSYVLYAEDKGYEYSTKPLNVAVGFDANGAITGVWVDVSGQTAGIGDQAAGADYLGQYTGITDEAGLDGVDTIAGATESTRGVKKAVRKCIQAYAAGLAS
ncbi:FMN-binding protein [Allofournierella massiliensis]|uniref:Ion-translocating oxidoreductase complex subunit G n=1 Tax=Allofournierella massiliensis TaxID=1650663 RepID=A0ABT7UQN5_9FIRM|nr:FMN-binding protein [Fournierella massiliensis]MDM8201201.1 FMN-binding protein [Fournierella massiliensis]